MSYKIIFRGGAGEITEKKSRFIAHIAPVSSEEEALSFLNKIRRQYHDARHHCYAYLIGSDNEIAGCSDDGEPSGSAGRPMLSALTGENLHNCIAVVVRYFGGTLLGVGGLVRAYSKATQAGLKNCAVCERMRGMQLSVRCGYSIWGKLRHLIEEQNYHIADIGYSENVKLTLIVPIGEWTYFKDRLIGLGGGQDMIHSSHEIDYALPDGELVLFR